MDPAIPPKIDRPAILTSLLEAEAVQFQQDGESLPHAPTFSQPERGLESSQDLAWRTSRSTWGRAKSSSADSQQPASLRQSPRPASLPHFETSFSQRPASRQAVVSLVGPDGAVLDLQAGTVNNERTTMVAKTLSGGFYRGSGSRLTDEAPRVAAADIIAEGLGLCSIIKHILQPDERASGDAFSGTPCSSIGITLKGTAIASLCIGSPAYLSGQLEKGDIITHIDGVLVDDKTIVTAVIGADLPGSMVNITVEKKSARVVRVPLQRTSANEMMRKKRVCELVHNLKHSAVRWQDSTSSREVDDLDYECQNAQIQAYAAEADLARHKGMQQQVNQHISGVQHLLSRLHVLASHWQAPVYKDTEYIEAEDDASKTWRTRFMELEDAYHDVRARLVDTQVDLSQGHLRETEVRHENDLLRQQLFSISSSDPATHQNPSLQQSAEIQELQVEVDALRAALFAAQAVDDENRATISDLTDMLASKPRTPSSPLAETAAHRGSLSADAQSAEGTLVNVVTQDPVSDEGSSHVWSQVHVLTAERDSALQKWEVSQLKLENLAQVLSSCHKTMAARDEAAHTQREYTVSLQEQLDLAKQHLKTVSKDCINLRHEISAGNRFVGVAHSHMTHLCGASFSDAAC